MATAFTEVYINKWLFFTFKITIHVEDIAEKVDEFLYNQGEDWYDENCNYVLGYEKQGVSKILGYHKSQSQLWLICFY